MWAFSSTWCGLTKACAPVINDVSWRTSLILEMTMKLDARIVDVETAFLFGELEEEVFMICKQVHGDDEVFHLVHSICGLVQSVRQCFHFFRKKLEKIVFVGGYPDPCLMKREDEKGIIFIAIWVDDSLLIGAKEAID